MLPISGKVYLDSNVFIYSVEKHHVYAAKLMILWTAIDSGNIRAYSSELAWLEVLVAPLRLSNLHLVDKYQSLLIDPRLSLMAINLRILMVAARKRAAHSSLRTPDAIHIATAEEASVDCILSNDRKLHAFTTCPVVLVDDL